MKDGYIEETWFEEIHPSKEGYFEQTKDEGSMKKKKPSMKVAMKKKKPSMKAMKIKRSMKIKAMKKKAFKA